jgi:hypothetical protein
MVPKILRRCSICGKFHASYLVIDPQLGKGYYCYSCFRAWQTAHPAGQETESRPSNPEAAEPANKTSRTP